MDSVSRDISSKAIVVEGLRIFRDNIKTFALLALVSQLIFEPIISLAENRTENALYIIGLALVAFPLWAPISTFAIKTAANRYEGLQIPVITVLKESLAKTGSMAWVLMISTIAICLGTMFLIIPGLIFLIYFALAPAVVALRDQTGIAALKRSRQLATGNWWTVCGIYCWTWLISFGTELLCEGALYLLNLLPLPDILTFLLTFGFNFLGTLAFLIPSVCLTILFLKLEPLEREIGSLPAPAPNNPPANPPVV